MSVMASKNEAQNDTDTWPVRSHACLQASLLLLMQADLVPAHEQQKPDEMLHALF